MPYGSWPSPLSAALVASQGLRLSSVLVDGGDLYWIEGRAAESGRNVLMRQRADGQACDVTPAAFNVRTRVHEYGGGACVVSNGEIYGSNFADQRIYRITPGGDAAITSATPLTPAGPWRYADAVVDAARRRLICVREEHTAGSHEPVNTLVGIALAGGESAGEVLASGYDFYSTPRLSPDGTRLAWIAWRHPQMPWDGSELWLAEVTASGTLTDAACVAGGPAESIYQPGWSPDGTLHYVSDRSGWWQLYRAAPDLRADGTFVSEPVIRNAPADAEFGRPQWVFGTATWAFADAARLVTAYTRGGRWHLAVVDVASGMMRTLAPGLEPQEYLAATSTHAVLVGGLGGACGRGRARGSRYRPRGGHPPVVRRECGERRRACASPDGRVCRRANHLRHRRRGHRTRVLLRAAHRVTAA